MCGICGRLNLDPQEPVDPGLVGRMASTLAHRGPDGEGTRVEGPVGLGHRRLAVIDLTENGRQPMPNEEGNLWITCNGEIYNFLELRAELLGRGHRFRSRTDTEVILHLYEEAGPACLDRLRGMFAFGIWDARARTLFLARDRLGKKPLFYYLDPARFLFASEPRAILACPDVQAEPDLEAIHHYLTYGYVPAPFSAFKGIRKLPPAHFLLLRNGSIQVEPYWRLSHRKEPEGARGEEEIGRELLDRLAEAVRLRMTSDVPLGAFLSGGIDSSAVVALMTRFSARPVKTFSVGFEDRAYDELAYARLVAKRFGTDHHELVVRPDAAALLPEIVWHYNEPFADSSALPTYCLARMAREGVTVALCGDGGDENFAGYDRYLAIQVAGRYDRLPARLRKALEASGRALLRSSRPKSFRSRARRFLEALSEPPERRYARWMSHFTNARKDRLYTGDFRRAVGGVDSVELLLEAYRASDAPSFMDATLAVDVQRYLPEDLLVKVDIASMAHALEVRSPLLDHPFMEFVAGLPADLKLRGRVRKYIFKKALRGLLPGRILHRSKRGFGVPIARWFRAELREMAHDVLLARSSLERGYFERDAIRGLLDEHCRGRANWQHLLWNLLMLELWHRAFIDASRPEGTRPVTIAAPGSKAPL